MTRRNRERLKLHAGEHRAFGCTEAMRMISRVLWPPPRFEANWNAATCDEIASIVKGAGYGPGGEKL